MKISLRVIAVIRDSHCTYRLTIYAFVITVYVAIRYHTETHTHVLTTEYPTHPTRRIKVSSVEYRWIDEDKFEEKTDRGIWTDRIRIW